jgi:RHS repeat-associated protein
MTTTSGSVYYHHDGLGNTIAITNGNAEVLERYSYDVFGLVTIVDASTGNAIPQSAHGVRHFYTGHDFQAELGLYLTHYRAYEPALGRWLSADPIGENGGWNLYGYGQNNPVTTIDPTGEAWILVGVAVVAKGYFIYKVYKYIKETNDFCKSAKEYKEVWKKIDEMSTEEFGNNFDDIQKELKDKEGKMIKDAGESAGAGGALPGTVGGGPGPRPLP